MAWWAWPRSMRFAWRGRTSPGKLRTTVADSVRSIPTLFGVPIGKCQNCFCRNVRSCPRWSCPCCCSRPVPSQPSPRFYGWRPGIWSISRRLSAQVRGGLCTSAPIRRALERRSDRVAGGREPDRPSRACSTPVPMPSRSHANRTGTWALAATNTDRRGPCNARGSRSTGRDSTSWG